VTLVRVCHSVTKLLLSFINTKPYLPDNKTPKNSYEVVLVYLQLSRRSLLLKCVLRPQNQDKLNKTSYFTSLRSFNVIEVV